MYKKKNIKIFREVVYEFVGTVHKFDILARSYMSKNVRSHAQNARSYVSKNAGSHAQKCGVACTKMRGRMRSKNARSHAQNARSHVCTYARSQVHQFIRRTYGLFFQKSIFLSLDVTKTWILVCIQV